MRKLWKASYLSIVCSAMVVLGACGGGTQTGEQGLAGEETTTSTEKSEQVVIKFGHGAAESNSRHQAVVKFKELVEEKSNNEITVNIFPSEQLGSEPQMVESVSFNDLEMVAAGTYSQYHPPMGVFELPFLFESNEEAWEVLDGPIGQEVAEPLIDHNLRVLAYFENGTRHVTNNSKPIETVEDLKGMKIRTPEIPHFVSTFKTLGANPTPMAFGELYMALQQGTVDGQENPITNIHASKFQEVQKYLSLTGHIYGPLPVAISNEFWQTLSSEQQEIVQSSALEAAQYHRDLITDNEKVLLAELEAAGVQINTPEREPFKEAAQAVYTEYEEVFGKELIERIVAR